MTSEAIMAVYLGERRDVPLILAASPGGMIEAVSLDYAVFRVAYVAPESAATDEGPSGVNYFFASTTTISPAAAVHVLTAALCSMVKTRAALQMENVALRHQIGVLQRRGRRPKLMVADRLFWIVLSRIWGGWRSALAVVKPDTVIAWHRKGFRL